MNLFLARHGNTFDGETPVVWVGSQNDFPLTPQGKEQARALGKSLLTQTKDSPLNAVYCSPLRRTRLSAEIIIEMLKLPLRPIFDGRLNEIDYGQWSGLTPKEVDERFGSEMQSNWNQYSLWPTQGNWGGSDETMITEVSTFTQELIEKKHENVLIVTSNGRLKYFSKLFQSKHPLKTPKVNTGHLCKITYQSEMFHFSYWNKNPTHDT